MHIVHGADDLLHQGGSYPLAASGLPADGSGLGLVA